MKAIAKAVKSEIEAFREQASLNDKALFIEQSKHETAYVQTVDFLRTFYEIRLNTSDMEYQIRDKNDDEPTEWQELQSAAKLMELTHRAGITRAKKEHIKDYLTLREYVTEYCPIQDYFETLPKPESVAAFEQGTGTLESLRIYQVCQCVGLEDPAHFDRLFANFRKWLIRAVKCIYEAQAYNKTMLLFTGGQNGGKSGFFQWLVPERLKAYYSNKVTFDKDGLIALAKLFIINIDEMAGLDKREVAELKSHISADSVYVRPPYGEKSIYMKRKASFLANTNEVEFLRDATGSVRFAVFPLAKRMESKTQRKTLSFDFDRLETIDVDTMWAEAVWLYKSGKVTGELTQLEMNENAAVAEQFRLVGMEEQLIRTYMEPYDPATHKDFERFDPDKHDAHTVGVWRAMNSTEVKSYLENEYRKTGGSANLLLRSIGSTMHALGFAFKTDSKDFVKRYRIVIKR